MKKKYRKDRYLFNYGILFIILFILYQIGIENLRKYSSVIIGMLVILITSKWLYKRIRKNQKYQKERNRYISSGISIVDKMDGNEFEVFLKYHFEALGYNVKLTKSTHDYGADLVLSKKNSITVVQAKHHTKSVGIKAIQEISGALKYYKAKKGVVVITSSFTKNAIKLAEANQIDLVDRKRLIDIMNRNKLKYKAKAIYDDTINKCVCPTCGNRLIKKHGKFGEFLGCSKYPKCTFTRNIKAN